MNSTPGWSGRCARATGRGRRGRCASTPRAPSTSSPACCRRRCRSKPRRRGAFPSYRDAKAPLGSDALALRVEERLPCDFALDPAAEDLDLYRRPRLVLGRQVGVGDRALDGVAVAAARRPADNLAADADRLVAEGDRARVVEGEAAQARARPVLPGGEDRLFADEADRLVEFEAEADAALVGGLVRGDVGAPDAVALLQSQAVDRPVAAGDDPLRLPRLPDAPPQSQAVLGRAVDLPAELADVGHPQHPHRHVAKRRLPKGHVREGLIAEVLRGQRLQHLARPRPPDTEAGPLRGDVVDLHLVAVGEVAAHPLAVVVAEGGPGDDREALLVEAGDGE